MERPQKTSSFKAGEFPKQHSREDRFSDLNDLRSMIGVEEDFSDNSEDNNAAFFAEKRTYGVNL